VAPNTAPIVVYLSSTLADLAAERQAIKDVLSGSCVVKESYDPSDANLVKKCLADVATCEVYIGVIGLRYGFVPPGYDRSITQLEYEQAKSKGLSRFVFIKNEAAIAVTETDAFTDENPKERIAAFRRQLTSGDDGEATPGRFRTVDELKLAVTKVISDLRYARQGGQTLMKGDPPHPWSVSYEISIACVTGTDQSMKQVLDALASGDQRIVTFELSPGLPKDYFPTLDAQSRKSRCVMVLVTAASLPRIAAAADDVAAAIAMVRERSAGVFGLLVDVAPDGLPANVRDAFVSGIFTTNAGDWAEPARRVTYDKLLQWRRARAPESPAGSRVAVPYIIVALNEHEAQAMCVDRATFFKKFGVGAQMRQSEFDALSAKLSERSPNWPQGFYGPGRKDWRPFGPLAPTMNDFVLSAARRLNQAARGTRERRLLRSAQITLLPYSFDEYLVDRSGSRENISRVCDLGCLVLLDEFALLHPTLREELNTLLSSNNAAVVSISACDPTLRSIDELLSDLSYLRVGNLLSRFSHFEDLRCELALNSVERLQRWLRLVLPELLTTLGQDQIDPTLAGSVDQLFEPAAEAAP
jgi:hypothetical protein